MSAGAYPRWKTLTVWVARLLAGAAFIVSGWAKLVDPSGFVFKIEEYLNVWGLSETFPREIVLVGAVGLSLFELITGVMLATGSLRRSAPCCGLLMMLFMLPLTAWIALADPVSECGCFGDLWVVSNTVTFLKNVMITALLVILLMWHGAAAPLYRPELQWMVLALTGIYGLVIAVLGWQIQPLLDFRPYGVGKELLPEQEDADVSFIYERDGERREFALESLPDDSWEFVGRKGGESAADNSLTIFDAEGDDVSEDVLAEPDSVLLIVVPEPGVNNLLRSRFANEMARDARDRGISVAGLVAASGDALQEWIDLALPDYDVYSASDTSLKQLVRGPIGLVYARDGKVVWKTNFASLDPDYLKESDNPFGGMYPISDGRVMRWLTLVYFAGLCLWLAISALTKINFRRKPRKTEESGSSGNIMSEKS
ncbi:MAG: DoxX family protein [Muribaculaceae bacterium]|nr:DoxX family protein [Muribaculaceae bacterium]